MIVTVAVVVGFKSEIEQKITGFSAPIQITGEFLNTSFENKPFEDNELTRESIKAFPFVEHLQPFALKPAILKANEDFEGVVLKGIDSSYRVDFFSKCMVKGRFIHFTPGEQSREVVVSAQIANKLNLDTGMQAMLWFVQDPPVIKKIKVVGIYQTDIEEIDNYFILADIDIVKQVSGWNDKQIGGYEVLLRNFDLATLPDQNNDIRFSLDVDMNSMSVLNRYPQIFDWLGLLNKNVQIIIILMTVVAIINMITALLIMILERTQMIGILKSMGFTNGGLMRIFVYNAAFFIGYGLLIGNVLGIGLVWLQGNYHFFSLSAEYYVTYVPVRFNLWYFLLIDIGTLLVCTAAMFLPALLTSKIVPVKALRFN